MGHSTCRLGIAIALIAGINGHLLAEDPPVSLNDYVTAMQKEGWAATYSLLVGAIVGYYFGPASGR